MTKITPRQIKIIEKLGEALQQEAQEISIAAAKGIIHYGLDAACGDLGIELAEVQDYDSAGKLEFMSLLMKKIGERLLRYHIANDRIEKIKAILLETYKMIM